MFRKCFCFYCFVHNFSKNGRIFNLVDIPSCNIVRKLFFLHVESGEDVVIMSYEAYERPANQNPKKESVFNGGCLFKSKTLI